MLRHFFVCALEERFACLRRALFGVVRSPSTSVVAKAATTTIPIVHASGTDPVQAGLVASLNQPGGNVTGVNAMNVGLLGKQLGLLHQLLPGAARFAVLVSPSNPQIQSTIAEAHAAGAAMGRQLEILSARTTRDFGPAFSRAVQKRAEALLISADPLFTNRLVQLATLATRHAMPTIYTLREFAEVGGLMSYGSDLSELFRQGGVYTGRILKGEKPGDLSILHATKFELVINLPTAEAFGLEIPATLLALADKVIE